MLKFRTMRVGADAMKANLQALNESGDPRLFKIKNDPRVTRVGRLLRRTSLDELPQVLNVLKGDMSLVGPRPFFRGDLPAYDSHHFERLHVLPGITGLWQVSGRSDVVDFEEVVRLDRRYIREWSVGQDLMILLRTIPAALLLCRADRETVRRRLAERLGDASDADWGIYEAAAAQWQEPGPATRAV